MGTYREVAEEWDLRDIFLAKVVIDVQARTSLQQAKRMQNKKGR